MKNYEKLTIFEVEKLNKSKANIALQIAKAQELQKLESGSKYTKRDNKTFVLK